MLLFWQEQGPVQQHVMTSARRVHGKAPDKLTNAPELHARLELFYDAFITLDTERSHGMGWQYIPWSAIVRYAVYYEFDEDLTDRLVTHIRAMDRAYVKKLADDAEAKRAK